MYLVLKLHQLVFSFSKMFRLYLCIHTSNRRGIQLHNEFNKHNLNVIFEVIYKPSSQTIKSSLFFKAAARLLDIDNLQ